MLSGREMALCCYVNFRREVGRVLSGFYILARGEVSVVQFMKEWGMNLAGGLYSVGDLSKFGALVIEGGRRGLARAYRAPTTSSSV